MNIPWQSLSAETLRRLIEEFVSRDGTDYGAREADFESKTEQIFRLIRNGKVGIVFDPETESCDLREIQPSSSSVENSGSRRSEA